MVVNLPNYVEITKNAKQYIDEFLEENSYSSIFILVDENTQEKCLTVFGNSFLASVYRG